MSEVSTTAQWKALWMPSTVKKAFERNDLYIISKLYESIPAGATGGAFFDYKEYLIHVYHLALEEDNAVIFLFVFTKLYATDYSLKQALQNALPTVIVKNKINIIESLVEKAKDIEYKIPLHVLSKTVLYSSSEILQLLLGSGLTKLSAWKDLQTLLDLILAKDAEKADEFLDVLFEHLDEVNSPLYNEVVDYVESNYYY